ncbi:MAG: TIGR03960 family B12-binding radical SAM protein [Vallitaleaceae bacterium]|nr:TIGR03960 family B12-binding radical SAM protein [Vallitaleaceae bacterium]
MVNDQLLLSIEKPAQYLGNEMNAVKKERFDLHFALCFPDLYEIGMSHLGLSILYNIMNEREDTYCERVFSPMKDMEALLRSEALPLFSLESQTPIKNFNFLGFTVQYEMSYTNILNILSLSGMALRSKDRSTKDPIVCAGGPCVYNPEPIAPFIDFFYIGEAEQSLDAVLDLYLSLKKDEHIKEDELKDLFLEKLLDIEGIYVPKYYDILYHEDGTIQEMKPLHSHAKTSIMKQLVVDLNKMKYAKNPIVPYIQPVHDRVVLELFRGCSRGCRFCQAGFIYRPVREKSLDTLKEQADTLANYTGHEEISLISLSTSDYSDLAPLCDYLIDDLSQDKMMNISLPSLRIDSFSLDLMEKVQDVRKSSLTFAPEAGSQRMRDVINKGISEEQILYGASQAFRGGWSRVKLYFMLGLPNERDEDVLAIAELAEKIVHEYFQIPKPERPQGGISLVVSSSFFIPKPFTPFQWVGQDTYEEFMRKQKLLNASIDKKRTRYNSHDAKTSMIEGVLARGDRKVADVIEEVFRMGSTFDAWSEDFHFENWQKAFEQTGIDPYFYCTRTRDFNEILPWDFINIGVTKKFLQKEYEKSIEAAITPNCMEACSYCGATCFKGGICFEGKN